MQVKIEMAVFKWSLKQINSDTLETNRLSRTESVLFTPTGAKNCASHLLLVPDKTSSTVHLHSVQDWNPQKASGWQMFPSPDCFALFLPRRTTRRPKCSLIMERLHTEHYPAVNLTSLLLCQSEHFSVPGDWSLSFLNYGVSSDVCMLTLPFSAFLMLHLSLFCQASLQHTEPCSVCTASNIFMAHECRWHAKQPNTMWNICGVLTEYVQCCHGTQTMQIVDTLLLTSQSFPVFLSKWLLF